MNIVLLGGPGSGKGTQAKALSEMLHVPHVASGDLFREHLKNQTSLGETAQAYISRGELVPDQVTIGMVRERLGLPDCQAGVILDGFPRTVPQAEALDGMLSELGRRLDVVAYIEVSLETLLKRLSGRLICAQCGFVYNLYFGPPKIAGRCDACGGSLEQRQDDRPEIQRHRIEVYWEQTVPLIDYYQRLGKLTRIDGEQDIAGVQGQLLTAIRAAGRRTRRKGSKS